MTFQGVVYNEAEISPVLLNRGIITINEFTSQSPQVHWLLYENGVAPVEQSEMLGDSCFTQVVCDLEETFSLFFGHS